MSRREIRRMLMTPKNRPKERRWLIPALMAGVLAAGVGVGVAVGLLLQPKQPMPQPVPVVQNPVAEQTAETPPRTPEEGLLRPVLPDVPASSGRLADFDPIVPLPPPRPGGPDDDGFDYNDPDHTPIADVPPNAALPIAEESRAESMPEAPPPESAALPAPIISPPAPRPQGEAPSHGVTYVPPPPPAPVQPVLHPAPNNWLANAVPAAKTGNHPIIAVMIDDLGVDKKRSERATHLRAPLTLAWMTYADDLPQMTQAARARGHELMVHMPMQPMADNFDAGRDVLKVNLGADELRRRINWGLDRFHGYIGINNHMGSRFTADRAGMRVVMEELHRRGLVFVDSVTSDKTVGADTARQMGVPFAMRNVFIDNIQTVGAITAQLQKAEEFAHKHGMAIAIGHPHDATLEALSHWLPGLESRGVVLVPVSTIIKRQNGIRD